jgi:hypothetical protein
MFRKLTKKLAVSLVVSAALIVGLGAVPASAAVPAAGSSFACSPGSWGTLPWCFGVPDRQTTTTLGGNTANCPGSSQYFSTTDTNGVGIQWTYSNGSHACVRVHYNGVNDGRTCEYWFYVPPVHATGTIVFGWWDWNNVKHYASLNENPVSGWQFAFNATNLHYIEFQDNNGQSGTQIGWANQSDFGFWVDSCR